MKRLFGFLIVAALAACTCLSQIPDQLIYVDQNCEAVLPDYTPDVIVTDNCDNATISQVPNAGTLLTSAQPVTEITITAEDISGNQSSISFNVLLVDTIPPTITAGPGLLSWNEYNIGKVVHKFHKGIIAMQDSIRIKFPETNQDTSYKEDNLLVISNLESRFMSANFVDPEYIVLAGDSTALANKCGINVTSLLVEFVDP